MEKIKCHLVGTVTSHGAYAVYDESNRLIGYTDSWDYIDYDPHTFRPLKERIAIDPSTIDESAWD